MDTRLPVDLLHWALAAAPLALLAVFLVWLRRGAAVSGLIGAIAAVVVALAAFRAGWADLAIAIGKGIWDSIFVLYVVWPALLLYLIAERGGAFEAVRGGIQRFSDSRLFQVLALGWVFASFLQGISGFGTPIAIVAPLLLAIGVRPIYAVVIPLIGHAWATMFGSIAVTWLATKQVIDMADPSTTAWQTAALLWIPDFTAGAAIAWLFGRWRGLLKALPLIAIISGIHGGVQLALALWQPVISNFVAGTVALLALYPLSRWRRYSEPAKDVHEHPAMEERGRGEADEAADSRAPMGLGMALFPYGVLTVVAIAVLLVPGVESFLDRLKLGLPFPEISTGYGVTRDAKDSYSPITPLTHPGFFLLVSCAATWFVYRSKGYFRAHGKQERRSLWQSLWQKALPASAAIVAFLVMSKTLDHSGQTRVLALGISQLMPSLAYASVAGVIGALGAFITSSSTASNLLLAPLQQTVAETEGLPKPTIIAAQSAGGAIGNAVAPANVVLGTSTAGLGGREGEILRKTMVWAALTAALLGAATVMLIGLA